MVSKGGVRGTKFLVTLSQPIDFIWRPQGDSNPCRRRERPVSWAGLDDGDAKSISVVGRVGLEPTTLCLKGRYSTV